jgi:hypothetical protein
LLAVPALKKVVVDETLRVFITRKKQRFSGSRRGAKKGLWGLKMLCCNDQKDVVLKGA